jgi:hypothetical protein
MEYPAELIDAVEFHAEGRLSAWFPHAYPLHDGGPEVVHLNPARHLALLLERNKCATGAEFDHPKDADKQVRRFLFTCSPLWSFEAGPQVNQDAFANWNARNQILESYLLIPAIRKYWRMMFLDSLSTPWLPSGFKQQESAGQSTPWSQLRTTSFIASYVRFFWEHFGLTKAEMLETPYPQLFQMMLAVSDGAQNAPNAADQYTSAWLWYQQQEPKSDE